MEEDAFLRISREDYFKNLLASTNYYEKARIVCVPREMLQDTKVKGLPLADSISFSVVSQRNYWHAMSLQDMSLRNGQRHMIKSRWALSNAVSSRQFKWRRE